MDRTDRADPTRPVSGRPRPRGSVILLVLFTILFAVYALTKFVERAAVDLLSESRVSVGDRLRLEAYSALEVTLAVLEDFRAVNGALRSPAEGWSDPLAFAGYQPAEGREATVAFEDESSKISLPNADFQALAQLFVMLGQQETDAERLADALLLWMRPGYEPSSALAPRAIDYERGAIPHEPPGRSLRSFAELAGIPGVRESFYDEAGHPNDLWRAFASSVSLFNYKQPNANGGNVAVLGAMGVFDEQGIRNTLDYLTGGGIYTRQGPAYFRTRQELAAVMGQNDAPAQFGVQISALRVNVTVREGQMSFRLSAVVAPPGGAQLPPAAAPADKEARAATNPADAATAPPETAAANTDSTASAGAHVPARLNYPFTLLDIRENDAIPNLTPSGENTDA